MDFLRKHKQESVLGMPECDTVRPRGSMGELEGGEPAAGSSFFTEQCGQAFCGVYGEQRRALAEELSSIIIEAENKENENHAFLHGCGQIRVQYESWGGKPPRDGSSGMKTEGRFLKVR